MGAKRTFVIGDVHGCLDMLKRLLEKIVWRPREDRLVFLGDYIDRGENSKGVVDYILALRALSPNVSCLLGNHEAIFLDYLHGKDQGLFFMNGGSYTVESYRVDGRGEGDSLVPPHHMAFYLSLNPWIELDDFYVVHAGFRPGVDVEGQSLHDMIWIREPFIYSDYDFGKTVIFGHTPFAEPLRMKNKIGLDTGAVYGNRLTCLELPQLKFHSVGT